MQRDLLVFIDMDGVVADFMGAALLHHGCPDFFKQRPNLRGEEAWELDHMLPGLSRTNFWNGLDSVNFWRDLPILPRAHDIIKAAEGAGRPVFLSSPNDNTGCCKGKMLWIRHHFYNLRDQFVFTRDKGLLAGPGRYLIEDRESNLRQFLECGGTGFLVPARWNNKWQEFESGHNWFVELARDLFCFSEEWGCC